MTEKLSPGAKIQLSDCIKSEMRARVNRQWLTVKEGRLARTLDKWGVLRDYGLIQKPRIFGRRLQSPRDNYGDILRHILQLSGRI